MAAQAILLALVGVPGIYFHSLFGSRGWPEGVKQTGHNRAINRQKLRRSDLERELAQPASLRQQVFSHCAQLLKARAASPAFHPHGHQQVVECADTVFAILRRAPDHAERVLCLQNVTARPQTVAIAGESLGLNQTTDLVSGAHADLRDGKVTLAPYQVLWLADHAGT